MKKFTKILCLVLAIAMLATIFAGCSKKNDTLVMATNAEFPPYEFKDGDGFAGIDVEIMQAIAADLGKELVIEDMEFDAIISSVESGKADVGAAGLTVTEDRLKNVNFSESYATAVQVIIVREDSAIDGDLTGLNVGVQQGTTGDLYVDWGEFGEVASIERYSKGFEAVQALSQGKIDAVVIDNEPAKVFVEENEGLKILESGSIEEQYALAVAKDNTELLDMINASLTKLQEEGVIQDIIEKYIPAE